MRCMINDNGSQNNQTLYTHDPVYDFDIRKDSICDEQLWSQRLHDWTIALRQVELIEFSTKRHGVKFPEKKNIWLTDQASSLHFTLKCTFRNLRFPRKQI